MAILERPAFLTAATGYPVSASAADEFVARTRARDSANLSAVTDDGKPLGGTAEGSAG